MNWGVLSGIVTAILIAAFIGVVIWAYSRGRKRSFEEASQLALDPEDRDIQVDEMEKRK